MTIFYSPSTGAFYDDAFWDAPLPDDATEVSAEDHAALLEASSLGKVIQAGPDGAPVAVDAPAPPFETLAQRVRRRRDAEIADLRWMIDRHRDETEMERTTTLSADAYAALLDHIQALRDVPAQADFPDAIDWPVLPAGPTEQDETQTPGEYLND
ncbi:MAG: phage tail assembly chaperone [Candidatus Brevundimonas colombiensis]|uniref:Phage tail assembly chaperone n=1 Tax=Candidatus Brevundimonas colombiensis TaxID=3121376 RepID=A0AAJ5WWU5_9CAUL|nr:phage tail assembly chaperone [Brevundimonas sp.]WEK38686.1 MAG: phage tail assembly chaperone [Brevundimonas sp.]